MSICEETNCTGCMACYNACPKHCILMNYNNIGILIPSIDEENCIRCNICSKICPSKKKVFNNKIMEAYACWEIKEEKRKTSSSGGIASIFYEHIINENGIVFGCNYDVNLQLKFSYTDSLKEIEKYKTSKYSQAYIGESIKRAREFLEQNRKVTQEEGTNFAVENGFAFMETSCLENRNVADSFETLIELTYKNILKRRKEDISGKQSLFSNPSSSGNCC